MKNMRKLIPAIAMLLVSAVMMSTASFAWFSMADNAVATGMEVKATAAGGFAIASYVTKDQAPSKDSFKTTASASYKNGDATGLAPTSHSTADAWYKGQAEKVDSSAVEPCTCRRPSAPQWIPRSAPPSPRRFCRRRKPSP